MKKKQVALAGVVALLLAILLLRAGTGEGFNPATLLVGLVGLGALGVMIAKHPAAFLAPMLFVPAGKNIPLLERYLGMAPVTQLGIATVALCLGMSGRLLGKGRRAEAAGGGGRERAGIRAYLFFAGVVALSYLYAPGPDFGAEKLWRFLVFGTLAFFAPFLLVRSTEDFRDFTYGTVAFAGGVAILGLRYSHHAFLLPGQDIVHIGIGQVMGLAILLLLYSWPKERRLRGVALAIGLPLFAAGLASAEARGPLVALIVALILTAAVPWAADHTARRKRAVLMVAGMAVLAVAVFGMASYWFHGVAQSRFQSKTTELMQILEGSTEAHGSATERLHYYQAAMEAVPQHLLLGAGLGGWSMYYYHEDYEEYPHNLLVEVVFEQGLVGLAALALLLVTILLTFKRNAAEASKNFPALFPILIYLFSLTMFSGDIVDNRFLWCWCGMVLACCGLSLAEREEAAEWIPAGNEPAGA